MSDAAENTVKATDNWDHAGKGKGSGLRERRPVLPRLTRRQWNFSVWYFLAVLALIAVGNRILLANRLMETIEFSEFKEKIRSGEIKRVEMGRTHFIGFPFTRDEIEGMMAAKRSGEPSPPPKVYRTVPVADESFVRLLDEKGVEYYGKQEEQGFLTEFITNWVLPIGFMMLIWHLISRRMGKLGQGIMSFGGSRAQLVAEGEIDVRFDDVAGVEEAKEELVEIVDFLKRPERYATVGGRIPKGVLLVGPPGTGKTLCARAVAGEAGVPFFKMSGADFVELFVGMGAARVRDLFRQAREKAPCIIFIDELDAIGKARGAGAVGGHDEREQTLNQLLVEMDGFDSRSGVIILAATNRPEILDPALLRPGRFDRQILVDRPDLPGREQILSRHAKEVKLDPSVDLREIAARTPGFAGADLANLVNEAALLAVRRGLVAVTQREFEDAIERIVAGLEKKNRLLNETERRIVAFHESGHALTAAFTPGSDPVKKITIVPRGLGALGYTMQTPMEDRFLMSEKELLGKIDVLLGGRGAEEVIFGEVSTGAANDLTRATEIARKIVTEYGMSEKFRNVVLQASSSPRFLGDQQVPATRDYSEDTQRYIDETVAGIINERYGKVLALLQERKGLLESVAERLLATETLGEQEFRKLIEEHEVLKA
jgi:cell division protease FtsH